MIRKYNNIQGLKYYLDTDTSLTQKGPYIV